MRTLVLDNAYFPVKIVSWQRAMVLLLTNRAEVVLDYSEFSIASVKNSFVLPKILKLHGRHRALKEVRFSRVNIFIRDNYQCQYCQLKLPFAKLTFDHVVPQSKGGVTSWENIVTSCSSCNSKKGSRTLTEARMKLLKIPKRPKWSPKLCLRLKDNDPVEWFAWLPGAT